MISENVSTDLDADANVILMRIRQAERSMRLLETEVDHSNFVSLTTTLKTFADKIDFDFDFENLQERTSCPEEAFSAPRRKISGGVHYVLFLDISFSGY